MTPEQRALHDFTRDIMKRLAALKGPDGQPKHVVKRRNYRELIVDNMAGVATSFLHLLVKLTHKPFKQLA